MARYLMLIFIFIASLIQVGCGGGSSGTGVGNTVTLSAGSTSGAATLVVSSIASSVLRSTYEELSFDIKSTANFTDGTAKNVTGFSEVISFEYLGSSDPTYVVNATLPSITQYSPSPPLAPGGTWTQKVAVGTPQIKEYVLANYITAFQNLPENVLRYKVTVVFTGTEATGKTITVTATGGLNIINQ